MSTISLQQLNQELETLLKSSNIQDLLSSYSQSIDLAKSLNNVVVTSLSPALDQINTLQTTVGGIVEQVAEPITEVSSQIQALASGLESVTAETSSFENSKIAQLNQLAAGQIVYTFNQEPTGVRYSNTNFNSSWFTNYFEIPANRASYTSEGGYNSQVVSELEQRIVRKP